MCFHCACIMIRSLWQLLTAKDKKEMSCYVKCTWEMRIPEPESLITTMHARFWTKHTTWQLLFFTDLQVTVPITRREAGGTTLVPIQIWTGFGTEVDTIGVGTRTESTGPSSEEEPILWKKWSWWSGRTQTPSTRPFRRHSHLTKPKHLTSSESKEFDSRQQRRIYSIRSLMWDLHRCCSVIQFFCRIFPFILSKTVRLLLRSCIEHTVLDKTRTLVTVTKNRKASNLQQQHQQLWSTIVKRYVYLFSMYLKYFFLQQAHQADTGNISSEFIPFVLQYSHNIIIYRKINIYWPVSPMAS